MRKRSFFFHFNKPATAARGKPVISVHWQGACHLVDNVEARVPTMGRLRPRQPRFVMTGKAASMRVENGVAILE